MRKLNFLLIFFVFACMIGVAQAQQTTIGALDLKATISGISVRAKYSGDSNNNNSALVEYRCTTVTSSCTTASFVAVTGGATNLPYNDRLATIGGASNPFVHEMRTGIPGLQQGTSYDVRVTFTDNDGFTNPSSNPVLGTISTKPTTPPGGGMTVNVNSNGQISSTIGSGGTAAGGQTVLFATGTYASFTVGVSGSANGFITIDCNNSTITDNASTTAQTIQINGNFLVLQNCLIPHSAAAGIVIGNGNHDIYIKNNILSSVVEHCADGDMPGTGGTPTHYEDAGINANNASTASTGANIYILNNTVTAAAALGTTACLNNPNYQSPGTGIAFNSSYNTIEIANNTVSGSFRDGISADDDVTGENIDVHDNVVGGQKDDGIESKGGNVNVRFWQNHVSNLPVLITMQGDGQTDQGGNSCYAGNTNTPSVTFGPLMFIRNTCRVTSNGGGEFDYKMGGETIVYVFHDSVNTTGSGGPWDGYVGTGVVIRNTLLRGDGSLLGGLAISSPAASPVSLDYILYDWTSGRHTFTDALAGGDFNDYPTYHAAWPLQDVHSIAPGNGNLAQYADPNTMHLSSTSSAIDKGVILPGWNDANAPVAAWRFSGSAPDIGAFEFNVVCTPAKLTFVQQPTNTVINVNINTIQVNVQDISGNNCGSDPATITLSIHAGTCSGMSLTGTLSGANSFSTSNVKANNAIGTISSNVSCSLDAIDSTDSLTITSNTFNITPDVTPPVPGGSPAGTITFTGITTTTVTVNWSPATDNSTPQTQIRYELCRSLLSNIPTFPLCESNGTIVLAFTTNVTSFNDTSLTPGTTYWYNVVAEDLSNNKAAYTSNNVTTTSVGCVPAKLVFGGQPSSATINATIGPVSVTIKDNANNTCTAATNSVTLGKDAAATWGTLTTTTNLTKTPTAGVATWNNNDLSVTVSDGVGSIDATSPGPPLLTAAISNAITISSTPVCSACAITTSNVTANSLTLTWALATDPGATQSQLQYRVYRSNAPNIDTLANTLLNGILVQDFVTNINSANLSGLPRNAFQWFQILVQNPIGGQSVYFMQPQSLCAALEQGHKASDIPPKPCNPIQ